MTGRPDGKDDETQEVVNTNVDRQWMKFRSVPGRIILFEAVVTTKSPVSCIRGVYGTALKVSVRAAPEKGKANIEVEEVIAKFLGIRKHQVLVVGGQASRRKRIQVKGMFRKDFTAAVAKALGR